MGSHVADHLSELGHRVRIFDSKPSVWLREDQEMIVGDLLDIEKVSESASGSDIVYNFAALADLNEALHQPLQTVRVNVLGNMHVLEACRAHKIKRFVYASTVYVYSREGSFYRCSKQASEQYIEEYQRAYGLDYTILRYGSLYGPRADSSNGLFRIVRNALEVGVVSYEGSPDAMREYIHVEDAAQASVVALEEHFCNQSVVLTGQEPVKVCDMLHMLAEIMGIEKRVEFVESANVGHYVRTPYAYQPQLARKYSSPLCIDLGQGLVQLIESVRQNIERK